MATEQVLFTDILLPESCNNMILVSVVDIVISVDKNGTVSSDISARNFFLCHQISLQVIHNMSTGFAGLGNLLALLPAVSCLYVASRSVVLSFFLSP